MLLVSALIAALIVIEVYDARRRRKDHAARMAALAALDKEFKAFQAEVEIALGQLRSEADFLIEQGGGEDIEDLGEATPDPVRDPIPGDLAYEGWKAQTVLHPEQPSYAQDLARRDLG
jgi:hypothetical protein